MARVVFDTGALIAVERGDRGVGALLHEAARNGVDVVTSSACVAESWRDPVRQARLTRALAGMIEVPLGPIEARGCGALLARSGTAQVADAAIGMLAQDGDVVVTSDPSDLSHLLRARGCTARVHAI